MPTIHRRWTTEAVRALATEQRAWPRYELVRGELVVTPAPGAIHQIAVLEVAAILRDHLDRDPLGIVMVSPADLGLEPGSVTQPDVFVVPLRTERWTPMRETPEILRDRVVWAPLNGVPFSIDLVRLFDRIASIARMRRVPSRSR